MRIDARMKTVRETARLIETLRYESSERRQSLLVDDNLRTVVYHNAMPFVPFKSNSVAASRTNPNNALWKRMFHFYFYNQERFMDSYRKRSNVETTHSMIKAKFGDRLRSKTQTAQINEALCKCWLIICAASFDASMSQAIEPTFWETPHPRVSR
jgi:hypothetical protein